MFENLFGNNFLTGNQSSNWKIFKFPLWKYFNFPNLPSFVLYHYFECPSLWSSRLISNCLSGAFCDPTFLSWFSGFKITVHAGFCWHCFCWQIHPMKVFVDTFWPFEKATKIFIFNLFFKELFVDKLGLFNFWQKCKFK